jgi:hypothetical protein
MKAKFVNEAIKHLKPFSSEELEKNLQKWADKFDVYEAFESGDFFLVFEQIAKEDNNPLPENWYDTIKKLGIPKEDAFMVGAYGADDWEEVKNLLNHAGLKENIDWYEMEDETGEFGGEPSIIFNIRKLKNYNE